MTQTHDTTRQALYAAVGVAVVMISQLIASHALRDGFFLSQFEATALPPMVVGGSLLSLFFVYVRSQLFRRRAPESVLPIIFVMNGSLFLAEWAMIDVAPRSTAIFLFFHVACFGSVLVSAFWSVVNERFDPHEAKQLIGRIGGGATFGGVLGGLAAGLAASAFEISTMILALGGLNLLCALGASRIGGAEHVTQTIADQELSSTLEIFEETPYLRSIALLVALGAFCQAVYDYVFKATAANYFETGAELVSFFALFHLSVSVLTFLIQNLFASRLLEKFGLSANIGSLPGAGAVLGLAALFFPGLASAAAMRGGIGVAENSLFRSGYELLYTPILPEKKRPTKSWIDVGGDKLGTALGGGAAFLVIGIFPVLANPFLIAAGIAASLASFNVTRRLQQGYVSSLASRLRSGTLRAADVEIADATTRLVLSDGGLLDGQEAAPSESSDDTGARRDPMGLIDLRARLRESSRAREAARELGQVHQRQPFVVAAAAATLPEVFDPILTSIADLRSGDSSRVNSALTAHHPLPRDLIPHVIPLLEDRSTADFASVVLRRVAPANTGALLDAALQSRTPLPVRRKLCEILGKLPTQRSVNGLVELLLDKNFELRFRAAASLLEIHRSNPQARYPRDFLVSVAEREAAYCRKLWRSRTSLGGQISKTDVSQSTHGRRVAQGLTFISTLLLMLADQDAMTIAIRGLADGRPGQRGTALEYLENVLPPTLVVELRPLVEDARLTGLSMVSRADMLSEIVRSEEREAVNLEAVRERVDAARARNAKVPEEPS